MTQQDSESDIELIHLPSLQGVFMWHVVYSDGTSLWQFDEERPDGREWAAIGEKPVKDLFLATLDGRLIHRVMVPEGATPVFFRRGSVTFSLMSGSQEDSSPVVHCIGWKQGEDAVYLFVFDDCSALLTSDFKAV